MSFAALFECMQRAFSYLLEREQERGYARTTGACNSPRPFSPAVQGSGAPVPLASGAGSQVQASPYIQRPASVPASVHSSPEELPIPARDPSPHDLFEVEEDQAAPLGQPTLFQTGGEKVIFLLKW